MMSHVLVRYVTLQGNIWSYPTLGQEIIDSKVPWDTTSPGGPNDKGRYTVEVMVADDESLGSNGRQK